MNTQLTEQEKEFVVGLAKAGGFHFKLTILFPASVIVALNVPRSFAPLFWFIAGILFLAFSVSFINLQFFQKCPRCSTGLSPNRTVCSGCGLNYGLGLKNGDGNEWLK